MLQALPTDEGIMMAARCKVEAVTQAIKKLGVQAQVSVASVNGPNSIVAAGAEAEVLMVMSELGQEGTRLSVSHAFHSPLMMPVQLCLLLRPSNPRRQSVPPGTLVPCRFRPSLLRLHRLFMVMYPVSAC